MPIPIFLSFPKPHMQAQETFVKCVKEQLGARGLEAKTLGASEYNMHSPLVGVRQLMLESNGAIIVAFRRYWIQDGEEKHGSDLPAPAPVQSGSTAGTSSKCSCRSISGKWMTSPWCQMEAAMAFQLGLPILILRERGVHDDGALERGITGLYLPEVDLTTPCDVYFGKDEWKQLIAQWEGKVRRVREIKGTPPLAERL